LRLFVYTTAQEILSRLKAHRALAGFRSLGTFFPLENFSLPLSAFHTPVYYTAYNEAILHIDAKSTHPWPVAVGGIRTFAQADYKLQYRGCTPFAVAAAAIVAAAAAAAAAAVVVVVVGK